MATHRLSRYQKMRDFGRTPEPRGRVAAREGRSFVVQAHAARRMHWDFRLEMEGVLRSWPLPKGPSLDPTQRRLAVQTEDHPVEYGGFEGIIPKGEYGGGTVIVWDRGTWEPEGDPVKAWKRGKLSFRLDGEKLKGAWTLVRTRGRGDEDDDGKNWLLIKKDDEEARKGPKAEITKLRPESVLTGRTLEQVARDRDRVWTSERGEVPPSEAPEPKRPRAKATSKGRRSRGPDASQVAGAKRGDLPDVIAPQLATLVTQVPDGDDWIHEIKFDGYRLGCRIADAAVRLLTRNAQDWTDKFPSVAKAAAALPVKAAWIDGEVVAPAADGTTSFQALQRAMGAGARAKLAFQAFDLLHLDGWDLRACALIDRKRLLAELLEGSDGVISWVDHVAGKGRAFLDLACSHGIEGVVSKRADSKHRSARTKDWLKIRCEKRQEVVVVGWTEPSGSRKHLGALLVGVRDGAKLRSAGKVGTGFTQASLKSLHAKLSPLEVDEPPVVDPPRGAAARGAHWVEPKLVAEVKFTEWTEDGSLRHPVFLGLREDKPAEQVVREKPADPPAKSKRTRRAGATKSSARPTKSKSSRAAKDDAVAELAGVRLTSPDKVLWPEAGLTKRDLAQHYVTVADAMLPHLRGRLLTLVRCPDGREGQCFYQKHATHGLPDSVHRRKVTEKSGTGEYLFVEDLAGVLALVQVGALEIHVWGSRVEDLERPDLVVFDLDPAPEVPWERMIEAARHVRDALAERDLESFLKTTGGKGLHVCLPLKPRADWDQVKAFSKAIVEELSRAHAGAYVTQASKEKRRDRIFLDWLRNGRGATAVAPYSTRARAGAPVATPIRWDELDGKLRPDAWTMANIGRRLASQKRDPWAGMLDTKQSLTASILRAAGVR